MDFAGNTTAWPRLRPDKDRFSVRTAERLDGATPHLTSEELQELRQSLMDRRNKLLSEIARLQNEAFRLAVTGQPGVAPAAADNGTQSHSAPWERVLRLSTIASKRSLLNEVEQALARIEKKTYGVCVETNKAISLSRLREIPWAKLS